MKLILRWIITAIALMTAVYFVPGIRVEDNAWIAVGVMAIVLGFVNAIIRPILKLLTCPLILLTLGLFVFVINGLMLSFSAWITQTFFNLGFYVDGFWPALIGAIIVGVVSFFLSIFLIDDQEK